MSQLLLSRLSASYSELEDRVRLTGAAENGATVEMWLTQRLLSLIIGHLGTILEQQSLAAVPPKPTQAAAAENAGVAPERTAPVNTAHVSAAEQKFASDTFRNAEPVRPAPTAQKWLIHTIDVASNPKAVRLIFKGDRGIAAMDFDHLSLRQWLHVLHLLCERAKWNAIVWPVWVASAARPAPKLPLQ